MKNGRKKNGFTLIELLGVIVIIAIVCLICVPLVIKYIEKGEKQELLSSTQSMIKEAQMRCIGKECFFIVEDGKMYESDASYGKGKYISNSGGNKEEGVIHIFADGIGEGAVHNQKWCAMKEYNAKSVERSDYVEGECKLSIKKNVLKQDWDENIDNDDIKKITLSVSGDKPNSSFSWDVSEDQDKGIMAYYIGDPEDDELDEIMIVGNGNIYAPEESNWLFEYFSNATEMLNFDLLNTSDAKDMRYMFGFTSMLRILDVSKFSMDQVEDVDSMFCDSGIKEEDILELDNFKSLSDELRVSLFNCSK